MESIIESNPSKLIAHHFNFSISNRTPVICLWKCLTEYTPASTTPSVSREFSLAVHSASYAETRSLIQAAPPQGQTRLLHPDRELVEQALIRDESTTHSDLISKYFDHSETASELCLHLHQHAELARAMYAPLLDLFAVMEPSCDRAFSLFLEFDNRDNPLPNSHTFGDIRSALSVLKTQLDKRFLKSRSRVGLIRRVVAAAPVCVGGAACLRNPDATENRELAGLAQLDATAKCAYVLSNDLGTIDSLVARLRAAVEGDKALVRLGLERGRERFTVQEVLKQLSKSHGSFLQQLEDLEEHICLCFYTVNKARSFLLQEICNYQTL